jgi:hypothetical protein
LRHFPKKRGRKKQTKKKKKTEYIRYPKCTPHKRGEKIGLLSGPHNTQTEKKKAHNKTTTTAREEEEEEKEEHTPLLSLSLLSKSLFWSLERPSGSSW